MNRPQITSDSRKLAVWLWVSAEQKLAAARKTPPSRNAPAYPQKIVPISGLPR